MQRDAHSLPLLLCGFSCVSVCFFYSLLLWDTSESTCGSCFEKLPLKIKDERRQSGKGNQGWKKWLHTQKKISSAEWRYKFNNLHKDWEQVHKYRMKNHLCSVDVTQTDTHTGRRNDGSRQSSVFSSGKHKQVMNINTKSRAERQSESERPREKERDEGKLSCCQTRRKKSLFVFMWVFLNW